MSTLQWDTWVIPGIPIVTPSKPPGVQETVFQAMTATLIYGDRDALLVDAFMTTWQASALADWFEARRKNLTTIYITHGHGDHWFGVGTLLARFPNAKAVITAKAMETAHRNADPKFLEAVWKTGFPGQIPETIVLPDVLQGDSITLEGNELVAVDLGHTDTDNTTCLHVPALGLVVAGDSVYNDVHLYLGESDASKRQEWLGALNTIASFKPQAVVASHKRPGSPDDPKNIAATKQYILDFDRLVQTTSTAQELCDQMLALYPTRVNPGWALWGSARAAKP